MKAPPKPWTPQIWEETLLRLASSGSAEEIREVLGRVPSEILQTTYALSEATRFGRAAAAEQLMQAVPHQSIANALVQAAQYGHEACVRLLSPLCTETERVTALSGAAFGRHVGAAAALLEGVSETAVLNEPLKSALKPDSDCPKALLDLLWPRTDPMAVLKDLVLDLVEKPNVNRLDARFSRAERVVRRMDAADLQRTGVVLDGARASIFYRVERASWLKELAEVIAARQARVLLEAVSDHAPAPRSRLRV